MSGKRTKCEKCNDGRGLAEYPDGTYCYACHFKEKRKNLYQIRQRTQGGRLTKSCTINISQYWLSYLENYYVTLQDINDWLISCTNDDGLAINFSSTSQWIRYRKELKNYTKMKWMYYGDRNQKQACLGRGINESNSSALCIVEDPISAIRVRHHQDVLLLGGTYLNIKEQQYRLENYSKIVLWLDGDEAGQKAAMRIRKELKLKYDVVNIHTTRDPKCYTDGEIKRILIQNDVRLSNTFKPGKCGQALTNTGKQWEWK